MRQGEFWVTLSLFHVNYFEILHNKRTIQQLGVTCLRLFISNKNASFICNVPCCYHLLDENHLFLQPSNGSFHESGSSENEDKEINELGNSTTYCFPLSRKLNLENSSPFCLGKNARMMSAYSLHKMVADEKVISE